MGEIRVVEIYGIRMNSRCAELLQIVMNFAYSGDVDARKTRRIALKRLGERGCTKALTYIVNELAYSGDVDARETRRTALDYL